MEMRWMRISPKLRLCVRRPVWLLQNQVVWSGWRVDPRRPGDTALTQRPPKGPAPKVIFEKPPNKPIFEAFVHQTTSFLWSPCVQSLCRQWGGREYPSPSNYEKTGEWSHEDLIPTEMTISNFTGSLTHTSGVLPLDLTVRKRTALAAFFVVDSNANYNALIGRDWIHTGWAIPSSLHHFFLLEWERSRDRLGR